jgi:predicted  nucleic acid-binding Zn-ribbon protein
VTDTAPIREKLTAMRELSHEVEIFTHKQTELFDALNQKFPKIEQFSNALKDAHELQMFTDHLTLTADEIEAAVLSFVASMQKERKTMENAQKAMDGERKKFDEERKKFESALAEAAKSTAKVQSKLDELKSKIAKQADILMELSE